MALPPPMQVNLFAKRKFLIVEDFGEMRNMIKGMLRLLGAREIDAARDAKEALSLIGRSRYDVILCDYNLGVGKNGQQMFEELRHKELIDMSTVFVMLTAENTRNMVMAVVEYEPDGYLTKPFNKDFLGARLKKLFARKLELSSVYKALRLFKYDEAIALIDERVAQKPHNLAHLIHLKAEICLQAERYDEARDIYESLLNERELPWARLGLGKVLFQQKQFHDAADHFNMVIDNYRAVMGAHDWLAKSQLALDLPQDAQSTLSKAVTLSPHVMNRQQALGEVAMQNKDFHVAEKALSEAANLSKFSVYNNPKLHANLAKSLSANGKQAEALDVAGRISATFENDPAANFYANATEAQILQNQGDQEGANQALAQAEQIYRSLGRRVSSDASLELAQTAASLGQADKAGEILRKMVLNNHDDEVLLSKATELFGKIGISKNPRAFVHSLRQEVVSMNNQGVRLLASGKFTEAIKLFTEAATSMTGNLVINLNAARAIIMKMERHGVESGLLSSVRKYLEAAKELAPEDDRLTAALQRYQKLLKKSRT